MALDNYIEDDWNDNALTGRSNTEKDVFYQYYDSGTGDLLKGVHRPRWRHVSGTVDATNQRVEMYGDDSVQKVIETPSSLTVGSWTVDHRFNSIGDDFLAVSIICDNVNDYGIGRTQNGYWFGDRSGGSSPSYDLFVAEGGGNTRIIDAQSPQDTNWHTSECTRDIYGNFELIRDGTSQGTGTDTTYNETAAMALGDCNTENVMYDNLAVQ